MRADARADGIDALLGGGDGDLGAAARLTRDGLDLNYALLHFRYLQLKELLEQPRMRPREHDLGTAARALYLDDVGTQGIAVVVDLGRHLLRRHKHRLSAPDIDEHVAPLNTLHDTRHDVRRAAAVLLVDNAALRLAQPLHDNLLCRLCRDASEVCGRHLDLDHVVDRIIRADGTRLCEGDFRNVALRLLDHFLDGKDVERPRIARESDTDVLRRAEVAPVC